MSRLIFAGCVPVVVPVLVAVLIRTTTAAPDPWGVQENPLGRAGTGAGAPIHPALHAYPGQRSGGTVKAWIFFRDKGNEDQSDALSRTRRAEEELTSKALKRRTERGRRSVQVDHRDLPIDAEYVAAVVRLGAQVHVRSRWLNGVSVWVDPGKLEAIARLPFVSTIQPVRRGASPRQPIGENSRTSIVTTGEPGSAGEGGADGAALAGDSAFYGDSFDQLDQIGLVALHQAGFTGAGMTIGVLDTGFHRSHPAFNHPDHPIKVVAEYDFVTDDGDTSADPADVPGQHVHGTYVLGTLAAYAPGVLVGAAYDADFVLCKTEDTTAEYPAEEDNFVAGLEFAEAQGADVITSSLGYIDWYTPSDLDGFIPVTSVALQMAAENGVACVTASGNLGHDGNVLTNRLIAPADARWVLTVGAVDAAGTIASFSSDGPSADGRVKPELLARGINTRTVSATVGGTTIVGVNGTSLSTPLVAGAVTCLLQGRPGWTVDHLRVYTLLTAGDYVQSGQFDPAFVRGYGVLNAARAIQEDCNRNGSDDVAEVTSELVPDCNENRLPDSCDLAAGVSPDSNQDGFPDECQVQPPVASTVPSSRYLTFTQPNAGLKVAIRVTHSASGRSQWVKAGDLGGGQIAGSMARLQNGPTVPRDWPQGLMSVGDCLVSPHEEYELSLTANFRSFTSPVVIRTVGQPKGKDFGDVVGSLESHGWGMPDGLANFGDVAAAVSAFQASTDAPSLVQVDMEPQQPDGVVTFSDLSILVRGFQGLNYPFSQPDACP